MRGNKIGILWLVLVMLLAGCDDLQQQPRIETTSSACTYLRQLWGDEAIFVMGEGYKDQPTDLIPLGELPVSMDDTLPAKERQQYNVYYSPSRREWWVWYWYAIEGNPDGSQNFCGPYVRGVAE